MKLDIAIILCAALGLISCNDSTEPAYNVTIDPTDFVATIDNPYLPLTPGTTFVYEGTTEDGRELNRVLVSSNTKVILGVTCVEVADTVLLDGRLEEATFDWYAQDKSGNVWYFGEDTKSFNEHGVVVSTEGSWEAGVDGALPGIVMLANPDVGHTYREEFLEGEAEDMAHVVSLDASVTVPYGSFSNCLQTEEWSPLEPGLVEYKSYARGVGVVKEVSIAGGNDTSALVSVTTQ